MYSYSDIVPVFISNDPSSSFFIYPDPATDNIQVEILPQAEIEIFNLQGQLVKSLIANGTRISIDISTLQAGMFLVKVKTEKAIQGIYGKEVYKTMTGI
jgi:hypothetical protein